MIQIFNSEKDNLIAAKVSGEISKEEVQKIHPLIHEVNDKNKKVNFYLELYNFHGYDLEGLWTDLKVDTAHLSDYGNMAIVGEKKWEEWAAKATNLFTDSEVKYFDLKDKESAKDWVGL